MRAGLPSKESNAKEIEILPYGIRGLCSLATSILTEPNFLRSAVLPAHLLHLRELTGDLRSAADSPLEAHTTQAVDLSLYWDCRWSVAVKTLCAAAHTKLLHKLLLFSFLLLLFFHQFLLSTLPMVLWETYTHHFLVASLGVCYFFLILFFQVLTISVENQSSIWGDISVQLTKQQQCSLDQTLAWRSEDLVSTVISPGT